MLTKDQLKHYWRYCNLLNIDLGTASRYVEPTEANFKVYSLEFSRIILSACSEVEAVGKLLYSTICLRLNVRSKNDIDMKDIASMLLKFSPTIYDTYMSISLSGTNVLPFAIWKENPKSIPIWWDVYTKIKHSRHETENFIKANLENAINSVSALAILINYLYFYNDGDYAPPFVEEGLLDSPYAYQNFCVRSGVNLPDCVWNK